MNTYFVKLVKLKRPWKKTDHLARITEIRIKVLWSSKNTKIVCFGQIFKDFFQFLDQNAKSLQLVHMITNPTQIKKMMISISEKEKDIIGIEESNLEDDIKTPQ